MTDLLAFADDIAPRLASRAREAEIARRLPEATIEEARAAGYFAMLTPKDLGGAGAPFPDFFETIRRMARGCTSSAWTLSFLTLHSWLLAKFEPALQDEVFADRPYALTPAPLAATGQATKVEGGYRVSGRWEWATGIEHADWVMVNCIEPGGLGPRFCVLPVSDVVVEDVWQVAGMAATGSNTVRVEDTFVPQHRTLEAWRLKIDKSGGIARHAGTNVGYPMSPVLALTAATPALGAAEGALAAFERRIREKIQAYSGMKQAEIPATHLRFGEALATVRAARLVWADAIRELERIGPMGAQAPVTALAEIRLAAAHIVKLANEAIDTLANAAGASSGFLASPIQRALRDVQMMRGHVVFDWDRAAQIGGKVALGLEPTVADLL